LQLGLKKKKERKKYRGKVTAGRTNKLQLRLLTEDKNYRQTDELMTTAHLQPGSKQPSKKKLALLLWNHHFDSYLTLG